MWLSPSNTGSRALTHGPLHISRHRSGRWPRLDRLVRRLRTRGGDRGEELPVAGHALQLVSTATRTRPAPGRDRRHGRRHEDLAAGALPSHVRPRGPKSGDIVAACFQLADVDADARRALLGKAQRSAPTPAAQRWPREEREHAVAVDLTTRPPQRVTTVRATLSWRSRTAFHRSSPSSAARSVDDTRSVNRMAQSERVGGGTYAAPVRNRAISAMSASTSAPIARSSSPGRSTSVAPSISSATLVTMSGRCVRLRGRRSTSVGTRTRLWSTGCAELREFASIIRGGAGSPARPRGRATPGSRDPGSGSGTTARSGRLRPP